jgi:hypothetical protein
MFRSQDAPAGEVVLHAEEDRRLIDDQSGGGGEPPYGIQQPAEGRMEGFFY